MLRIVTPNTRKSELTNSNKQLRYLKEAVKKWNQGNSAPKVPDSHVCIIEFYQNFMKHIIVSIQILETRERWKVLNYFYVNP